MNESSQQAILRVADVVGQLIEFWGFKRNMGRLWCILFLEKAPLSAAELAQRLSLSSGTISMTLAELSKWGVVKKAWVPGERRDYYEPETDIWKMVSRVLRERELEQVKATTEEMERAQKLLSAARTHAHIADAEDQTLEHAHRQIGSLLTLTQIGQALLENIISGKSVDADVISGFSIGSGPSQDQSDQNKQTEQNEQNEQSRQNDNE